MPLNVKGAGKRPIVGSKMPKGGKTAPTKKV